MNLFFLHIPSTAGTCMWSLLREVYRGNKISRIAETKEDFLHFCQSNPTEDVYSTYRVIGGHIPFQRCENFYGSRKFFTMLRNPINRLKSNYARTIRTGRWTPQSSDINEDIICYAKSQSTFLNLNNRFKITSTYLSNIHINELSSATAKMQHSDDIIETLSNKFHTFGIQEYFDESLFLFKYAFQWPTLPTYDQRNIGGNNTYTLSKSCIDTLYEFLEMDLHIYHESLKLFQERLLKIKTDDFEKDLKIYRENLVARKSALLIKNNNINPYKKELDRKIRKY